MTSENTIETTSFPSEEDSPTHYDGGEYDSIAHVLAEETGRPVEDFEYDGPIPDPDELESVPREDW